MKKYKKYSTYPKIGKMTSGHLHNYILIVGTKYSMSKKYLVNIWKCSMCSTRTERKI